MSTEIRLEQIRLDGGTQPRAFINASTVDDYAESFTEGIELPPVVLFFDGENYWLADGFHRVYAARKNGFLGINADIRQGTREDAQWYSFGANKTHGLRRTNQDKQRAVEAALKHALAKDKSAQEIALHCGVSDMTVLKYRDPISKNLGDTGTRKVTRNGTTFTMKTAPIGKRSKMEQAPRPSDSPSGAVSGNPQRKPAVRTEERRVQASPSALAMAIAKRIHEDQRSYATNAEMTHAQAVLVDQVLNAFYANSQENL